VKIRIGIHPLAAMLAIVAALPFPVVTLALRANVSSVDPCDSRLILDRGIPLAIAAFVAGWGSYYALMLIRKPGRFAVEGALTAGAIIAATSYFGIHHHRDYYSALFIDPIVLFCVILYWFQSRPAFLSKTGLKGLGMAGLGLFFLFSLWIMMMGYAIATRAEPRPTESILYNAYNVILALVLMVLSRTVYLKSRRSLELKPGGVFLDGSPVDAVLGEQEIAVLRALIAAPERRLACSELQRLLDDAKPGRRSPEGCATCAPKDSKATLCPGYRGLYNRVFAIKRLLEFLEVGTILAPENKFEILSVGWKLVLFEGVRVRSD